MTALRHRRAFTLAVHPGYRGFGWVLAESPLSIIDWGIVEVRQGDKNLVALRRLGTLLSRYQPDTLVLEAFFSRSTKRHARIERLCRGMMARAHAQSVDVAIYTRADVRGCFVLHGAKTRHEIAAAVAARIDLLAPLLPKPRRAWESEHRNAQVFGAAALVLCHYDREARRLLDGLSGAD